MYLRCGLVTFQCLRRGFAVADGERGKPRGQEWVTESEKSTARQLLQLLIELTKGLPSSIFLPVMAGNGYSAQMTK